MAMYDIVFFACPNCGHEIEVTATAGDCVLMSYHIEDVPSEIADELSGGHLKCGICGCGYQLVYNLETGYGLKLV